MGEQQLVESPPAAKSPWLKAIIGGSAGLLSGALMMYLSPLLDKVVKPARPVANFAIDHQGTTVTFYNRSSGGGEGWWDFGDGSPLEPVSAKQETITHTYANPGSYVAKLTLRNLIGEESDRTVNLQLDVTQADPPEVVSLDALPISSGGYAPATFRVVSKAKNARLCVWDFGDDRPFQINTETPNNQDQLVTFKTPGSYMVKLVAVNGEQHSEKNTIVLVDEPPRGTMTAILTVTDQATRVEKVETPIPVTVAFPPGSGETEYNFDQPVPAKAGFEITAARYETIIDRGAESVEVKLAPDHKSAHVTGKLVRESSLLKRKGPLPSLMVRVVLNQENRLPAARPPISVTASLAGPGAVVLPLPALPENWVNPQRQMRLEMRDGDRVIWPESQLPHRASMTVKDRPCTLTATAVGDQVRVELNDAKPAAGPVGN